MMSSLLFPPHTNEAQFDEKWSFIGKKEKNVTQKILMPKTADISGIISLLTRRTVLLSVLSLEKNAENTQKIVKEFKNRTGGRTMRLITTDKYMPYKEAILTECCEIINPVPTGKPGRPRKPYRIPKPGLNYAMVKKHLKKGRIDNVEAGFIFGTKKDVDAALKVSKASKKNQYFIYRTSEWNRSESKF